MLKLQILLLSLLAIVHADVYLHSPRGSNNRLDGAGRNRRNANRLFDSQNNARGGYNVGSLYYYSGTKIYIEWTNQHSCNDQNNNCQIILQYMCGDRVRDGTTERTIPERQRQCRNGNCNTDLRYGMHEDRDYYLRCTTRQRNTNLFTADQKLRRQTARYTRQNPQGTRRGYECPEEKDYYPYWGPTPWKDIAIFTSNTSRCEYYKAQSQNVKDRYECIVPRDYLEFALWRRRVIPNNKEDCEALVWPRRPDKGKIGRWVKIPAHNIAPPECMEAPWSRDNHNGNGIGGYPNSYNWTAPSINEENCVLRIRYNISTNDYEAWDTDAESNGRPTTKVDIGSKYMLTPEDAQKRGYVFKTNPEVQPLSDEQHGSKLKLRLAINTAQYGRTFQDRSHTFAIRQRPPNLVGKQIHNVNVRGKRGNIVQVYPAVEYDFVPNVLHMSKDHYIHFQWTGSNSNPGNNAGQGQRGSDRSNIVLMKDVRFPLGTPGVAYPYGKFGHWGVSYPEHVEKTVFLGFSRRDLTNLAYLEPGQYLGDMNELNDAGTYFDLGPRKVTRMGTFHYMCTRNNNFSNRSQKGKIVVHGGQTGSSDTPHQSNKDTIDPKKSKSAVKDTNPSKPEGQQSDVMKENAQDTRGSPEQSDWIAEYHDHGDFDNVQNEPSDTRESVSLSDSPHPMGQPSNDRKPQTVRLKVNDDQNAKKKAETPRKDLSWSEAMAIQNKDGLFKDSKR